MLEIETGYQDYHRDMFRISELNKTVIIFSLSEW